MHERRNAKECAFFTIHCDAPIYLPTYLRHYVVRLVFTTCAGHRAKAQKGINTIAYIVSLYQKLLFKLYTEYYTCMDLSYFVFIEISFYLCRGTIIHRQCMFRSYSCSAFALFVMWSPHKNRFCKIEANELEKIENNESVLRGIMGTGTLCSCATFALAQGIAVYYTLLLRTIFLRISLHKCHGKIIVPFLSLWFVSN